ncbi:hypothetical protein GOC68_25490 [Sinorhizobium medicae]|nr:hypothetical protein [Sinorhizobium medicae]
MIQWLTDVLYDTTRAAVVAAWFTALGAFLAAGVGAIVAYIVARRPVYINAVTAERSKWIEALRKKISGFSGAADRLSSSLSRGLKIDSAEWATQVGELHSLLSELTLRLNPSEPEARNLLRAAKKLEAAARIHNPASLRIADEVMIRHAQWVLKAEWERVKQEASGPLQSPVFWLRRKRRKRLYRQFLRSEGSMTPLDAIGAGKTEVELTLVRSRMDVAAND